ATATEIADHLRVLFARTGVVVCPDCGVEVRRDSPDSVAARVAELPEGRRLMVAFAHAPPAEGERWADWSAPLIEAGFVRAVIDRQTVTLADGAPSRAPSTDPSSDDAYIIVDRLRTGDINEARLGESIETALVAGDESCVLLCEAGDEEDPGGDTGPADQRREIDGRAWSVARFSTRLRCDACDRDFKPPEPRLFDFNNPLGACAECEGFGSVVETDMNLIVPDRSKSLRDGAIAPWNTPAYSHELDELLALAPDYGIAVDAPFGDLTDEQLGHIVHGVPERDFGGLDGFLAWLERRKYKMHVRVFLSRWRSYRDCPACGGARLSPDALAVRVAGKTFADVMAMGVNEAIRFLADGQQESGGDYPRNGSPNHHQSIAPLREPVLARLRYLDEVGLAYLTLDRPLRTLSA
ncbi:MAG: excinuclease ABC subunit A, partial [Planctomycetota bacterium]